MIQYHFIQNKSRGFLKMKGVPISPEDLPERKSKPKPPFVYDIFNTLLEKNNTHGDNDIVIQRADAFERINTYLDAHKNAPSFKYEWLDIEDDYNNTGWDVTHLDCIDLKDDEYMGEYIFSRKKKSKKRKNK